MNASPIRCLITAGPTREFFDPVRYISNPSSGKMGYALAAAARAAGWQVELISGPVALRPPEGVEVIPVITGREMLAAVKGRFPACDILIKVAAVCDMRPKHYSHNKVKKDAITLTVEFEPVEDILKTVAATKRPDQVVVGFAAETQDVEAYARRKLEEKNLDWIVANQVGGPESAFESDRNAVQLIGSGGEALDFGPGSKTDVAHQLIGYLKAFHFAP
ncbi:phosphopantothenoylcysteine decarboxylase [Ruficoccus sp. ZRK36]|uniref:phosphopantothenoylcysteine decarboxylase n=1 Tax=Ruficoccus sp. ZRK36 TaxID=2866311 RepID=UPI001C72C444|nr:phosphopantothenoylcysteine decarboxylase [Ruficoccus sp. ZRK36]QYY34666.1 phosphopantothenoylcysteine decarboxylase [Ruficoccus sp. ZRK36]